MKIRGEILINAIVNRLNDLDIRCYDSAIVRQIRELSHYELNQILYSGEVSSWRNERINKSKEAI